MKVYLALQYYDNGEPYEDRWDETELIGVYDSKDGAMDAIDRMIEDVHINSHSINADSDTLPFIQSISKNGNMDIIKYRAMMGRDDFGNIRSWQYYILEQEVRS